MEQEIQAYMQRINQGQYFGYLLGSVNFVELRNWRKLSNAKTYYDKLKLIWPSDLYQDLEDYQSMLYNDVQLKRRMLTDMEAQQQKLLVQASYGFNMPVLRSELLMVKAENDRIEKTRKRFRMKMVCSERILRMAQSFKIYDKMDHSIIDVEIGYGIAQMIGISRNDETVFETSEEDEDGNGVPMPLDRMDFWPLWTAYQMQQVTNFNYQKIFFDFNVLKLWEERDLNAETNQGILQKFKKETGFNVDHVYIKKGGRMPAMFKNSETYYEVLKEKYEFTPPHRGGIYRPKQRIYFVSPQKLIDLFQSIDDCQTNPGPVKALSALLPKQDSEQLN